MRPGRLYYGDNLAILRSGEIPPASVDLVYLDPPFNSNREYNVLFQERNLDDSRAQIRAFDDTWHWDLAAQAAYEELTGGDATARGYTPQLSTLIGAIYRALPERSDLTAYLVMMAPRLVELHRVLSSTGTLYLHCDPTASHYLKLLLDAIFGARNFMNEVIWQRTNARTASGRWPRLHDVLLVYAKAERPTFAPLQVPGKAEKLPHTLVTGPDGQKYQTFELTAPNLRFGETGDPWRGFQPATMGRCWSNPPRVMDEWDRQGLIHWPKKKGGWPRRRAAEPFKPEQRTVMVGDVWTDIDRINQSAKERLGYPTQKPIALLERIISASSKPGDVVLDPFCGCGTTVEAVQRLGREWIGIDIATVAVRVVRNRLAARFPGVTYELVGDPQDLEGALDLAESSPYEFQSWAVHKLGAHWSGKKGKDRGVDGRLKFRTGPAAEVHDVVISVKGGRSIGPAMVRELAGTVAAQHAAIGVLVTAQSPSPDMRRAAADAGFFRTPASDRRYARVQLLSVQDIFEGRRVEHPGEDLPPERVAGGPLLPGFETPAPPPRKAFRIRVPDAPAVEATPLAAGREQRRGPRSAAANKPTLPRRKRGSRPQRP